jgi:hypothetical protein
MGKSFVAANCIEPGVDDVYFLDVWVRRYMFMFFREDIQGIALVQ